MKIAIFIILGLVVLCAVAWVIGFIFFRARMQHYVFAHQLLPSQMFAEPVAVLVPMVSPTGFSSEGREHLLRFLGGSRRGSWRQRFSIAGFADVFDGGAWPPQFDSVFC